MTYFQSTANGRVTHFSGALLSTERIKALAATHEPLSDDDGRAALAAQNLRDAALAKHLQHQRANAPHMCGHGSRPGGADRWPQPTLTDGGNVIGWRLQRPAAICSCGQRLIPVWGSDGRAAWGQWPWHGWITQPRVQCSVMRQVMTKNDRPVWPGLVALGFRNLTPILIPILLALVVLLSITDGHTGAIVLSIVAWSCVCLLLAQRPDFRDPQPLANGWDHAAAGAGGVLVTSMLASSIIVLVQAAGSAL